MNYDRIASLKLSNFRNIKDALLSFGDSSIITVIGDNEAGKSNIPIATTVLGGNKYYTKQKDFIRSGTDGFMVAVQLDNPEKTIIYRNKDSKTNGYGIIADKKIVWSIDKLEDSTVPPEIDKYMGFIYEPESKELLNVRSYSNLLLLVDTSGGSNYKVVYNALKTDNVYKAIKNGTAEANGHRDKINSAESAISTLQAELRDIKIIDISPLEAAKKRLNNELEYVAIMEEAITLLDGVNDIQNQLSYLHGLDNVELVNELEVGYLAEIRQLLNDTIGLDRKIDILEPITSCEFIDTSELELLKTGVELINTYNDSCKELEIYSEFIGKEVEKSVLEIGGIQSLLKEVGTAIELSKEISDTNIEIEKYSNIMSVETVSNSDIEELNAIRDMINMVSNIEQIGKEIDDLETQLSVSETKLKSFGVLVTTCRNCGETVIVEMG